MAGTGVFDLTSYPGFPTNSIINSPDKSVVFPLFSDKTTFLSSSVTSPSPDTFSLASYTDGFDTCVKKVVDEEEKVIICGTGTGVFNFTHYLVLPTESIIISPDKAVVFPSFSDTTTFLDSSVTPPLPMTHFHWPPRQPYLILVKIGEGEVTEEERKVVLSENKGKTTALSGEVIIESVGSPE